VYQTYDKKNGYAVPAYSLEGCIQAHKTFYLANQLSNLQKFQDVSTNK
jgi:hypothetical protein